MKPKRKKNKIWKKLWIFKSSSFTTELNNKLKRLKKLNRH